MKIRILFLLSIAVACVVAISASAATIQCPWVSIDTCVGTPYADTMRGGDDPQAGSHDKMWGMGGGDQMSGLNGPDYINGNTGNDNLYGNAGNDTIWGGTGSDYINGGDGADTIRSGCDGGCSSPGGGTLIGGYGNDVLGAENGVYDVVKGGPGDDHCWVDPGDYSENCVRH